MNVDALLDRLDKVRPSGRDKWMACCPAHEDKSPSLAVTQVDGRVLIHCFGGCGGDEVLNAVGLDYGVLYPEDMTKDLHERFMPAELKKPIRKTKKLYDDFYIAIFKSDIKKGQTPTDQEKVMYREAVQRRHSGANS